MRSSIYVRVLYGIFSSKLRLYVPVIRGEPSPVTTWPQVSVPLISRPVTIPEGVGPLPPGAWPAISAATFSNYSAT